MCRQIFYWSQELVFSVGSHLWITKKSTPLGAKWNDCVVEWKEMVMLRFFTIEKEKLMMAWPRDFWSWIQLLTSQILPNFLIVVNWQVSLGLVSVVIVIIGRENWGSSWLSIPVIGDSNGHGALAVLNIHSSSNCGSVACKIILLMIDAWNIDESQL